MGRSLLLLVTGSMVMVVLAMGSVRESGAAQDQRVTSYESDVIARENALSALNQAMPYVASRFDSLVSGQAVNTRPLVGVLTSASASTQQRTLVGGLVRTVLTATTNRLALTVGGAALPLMPTRALSSGSTQEVSVRALVNGKLEVTATGVHLETNAQGTPTPHAYILRRVYGKATALDAAVVMLAPAVTPTFSGTYQIDGRDIDPSTGNPTGNVNRYRNGIRTNASVVAQRLGAVIGTANKARVRGVAGDGDIVNGVIQANLDAIFDEAFTYSGSNRSTISSASVGTATYGSEAAPRIVVRDGDLSITGTLQGTGMLVVDGNLVTSGSGRLVWDGVVMVRKDSDNGNAADNLTATLGAGSKITGSLVVIQRSSAFVMPFGARLKVFYESSNAGILSSVGVEHSLAGRLTSQQIVAAGANRTGDVTADYTTDLEAGQQVNFWIGAYYPSTYGSTNAQRALRNTLAYKHYARGHFASGADKPYGITTAHPDNAYQWYMAFEDIDEALNIGFGTTPDWDYATPGQEDQKIRIALQCRAYNADGSLKRNGAGVQQYEDCIPSNPDTQQPDVALNWMDLTSTSGQVASPSYGGMLTFSLASARVNYSSETIAKLGPFLNTIRTQSQLVLLDQWTSR